MSGHRRVEEVPLAESTPPAAVPGRPLQWVIIGGGIHGSRLAVRLLAEGRVAPDAVRIVDPAPALLDGWRRCTTNTGMRHLRSPAVHHLGVSPWSLIHFAKGWHHGETPRFAPPYQRPAVELFADHSADVLARHGVPDLHVRDRAVEVSLSCRGATVRLERGAPLRTRRVLLAMGAGGRPRWPDWARRLRERHRIQHVFDPGFELDPEDWPERVVVVGGGISAAQVALRLAAAGRRVDLVSRHALRRHQFDSDPGWIGPKYMRRFDRTRDPAARRRMITDARHAGSMPADVHKALLAASRSDPGIRLHQGEPTVAPGPGLVLEVAGARIPTDGVLLATGFEPTRPGGALVDRLVETHRLPCAACGYPLVDRHLRWHPRVFVTGPLAELELGPVARNIIGARRAAERIVPASSTPPARLRAGG